jgi:hypothetical protein
MYAEKNIKWYQCKRDISIITSIFLIFGIAILHFEISENFRKYVWAAFTARTGMHPNRAVSVLFELGFWLPTLAVLIESIFVGIKHYWSWLIITLLGLSFFLTIGYLHNLESTKQIVDILRSEFSDLFSMIYFFRDFSTYLIFSAPYAVIVSVVVFAIRKKCEGIQRVLLTRTFWSIGVLVLFNLIMIIAIA